MKLEAGKRYVDETGKVYEMALTQILRLCGVEVTE